MPRITAVIAVLNAEKTIEVALSSLLSQTIKDLNVIVVDNGSTDSTLSLLHKCAEKDSRIVVQQCTIPGPFPCRNQAMSNLDCEFVAVMDGDDICAPIRFDRQIKALEEEKDLAATGSRIVLFGDNIGLPNMPLSKDECEKALSLFNPCCHPTLMIRRAALEKAGIYDLTYKIGGDFDLVRRLSYCGGVKNLNEPLLLYRVHNKQITSQRNNEQKITAYSVLKKHYTYLCDGTMPSDSRIMLEMSKSLIALKPGLTREGLRAIKSFYGQSRKAKK